MVVINIENIFPLPLIVEQTKFHQNVPKICFKGQEREWVTCAKFLKARIKSVYLYKGQTHLNTYIRTLFFISIDPYGLTHIVFTIPVLFLLCLSLPKSLLDMLYPIVIDFSQRLEECSWNGVLSLEGMRRYNKAILSEAISRRYQF